MAKYTKRRDKRGYEWKSAYREKEALMLERGYPEVSPHDFYRELFPAGSLQQEPEDGKGNIIATQIRPSGKGRTYKHYVQSYHEDEEITPEQAHKNAVELAEHTKAWKGHEVLIATHIDKGHIHTHFIVNSVNYENGHKLQWM